MDNTVEKFDPSKLMNGVKDRIKSTFVSLIPDAAWKKIIEKEIYIFTEGKIVTESEYNTEKGEYEYYEKRIPYQQSYTPISKDDEISPLQRMIRDELQNKFRESIKKTLDGEEYQGYWFSYGEPILSKVVKEVMVENADTIFLHFMSGIMQYGLSNMKNSIMNELRDPSGYRPW